jgi:hypothetical protein
MSAGREELVNKALAAEKGRKALSKDLTCVQEEMQELEEKHAQLQALHEQTVASHREEIQGALARQEKALEAAVQEAAFGAEEAGKAVVGELLANQEARLKHAMHQQQEEADQRAKRVREEVQEDNARLKESNQALRRALRTVTPRHGNNGDHGEDGASDDEDPSTAANASAAMTALDLCAAQESLDQAHATVKQLNLEIKHNGEAVAVAKAQMASLEKSSAGSGTYAASAMALVSL